MAIWLILCGAEKRDMDAAKRFFKQAVDVVGHAPERVTTDGDDSYPRAIRETLGSDVLHRTNRYLNNRLEPGPPWHQTAHYPMRGFGSVASASRFCRVFDEVRQFFRVRTTMKQKVSLAEQRRCSANDWTLPRYGADGLTSRRIAGEVCPTYFVDFCVLSSDTSATIIKSTIQMMMIMAALQSMID